MLQLFALKLHKGVRNRGLAVFIASIVLRAGFSHLLLVSGQTTTTMATHVRVFMEYQESIYSNILQCAFGIKSVGLGGVPTKVVVWRPMLFDCFAIKSH